MGDKLEVLLSKQELEKIIDGYAEQSSVEQIAYRTGITPDKIRQAFDDPEIVRLAMQRKAAKVALWSFGKGLDRLQQIITEGSDSQAINAFRELTRTLASVSPESRPVEPPKTLEESLREMSE